MTFSQRIRSAAPAIVKFYSRLRPNYEVYFQTGGSISCQYATGLRNGAASLLTGQKCRVKRAAGNADNWFDRRNELGKYGCLLPAAQRTGPRPTGRASLG